MNNREALIAKLDKDRKWLSEKYDREDLAFYGAEAMEKRRLEDEEDQMQRDAEKDFYYDHADPAERKEIYQRLLEKMLAALFAMDRVMELPTIDSRRHFDYIRVRVGKSPYSFRINCTTGKAYRFHQKVAEASLIHDSTARFIRKILF